MTSRRELKPEVAALIVSNVCDFLRDNGIAIPHEANLAHLKAKLLTRSESCEIGLNSSNAHGAYKLYLHTTHLDTWRIAVLGNNNQCLDHLTEMLALYVNAGTQGDRLVLNSTYLVGIGPLQRGLLARLVVDHGIQKINKGSAEEREEHVIAVQWVGGFENGTYRHMWAEVTIEEHQTLIASMFAEAKIYVR